MAAHGSSHITSAVNNRHLEGRNEDVSSGNSANRNINLVVLSESGSEGKQN
jgi:hypothetical protein